MPRCMINLNTFLQLILYNNLRNCQILCYYICLIYRINKLVQKWNEVTEYGPTEIMQDPSDYYGFLLFILHFLGYFIIIF